MFALTPSINKTTKCQPKAVFLDHLQADNVCLRELATHRAEMISLKEIFALLRAASQRHFQMNNIKCSITITANSGCQLLHLHINIIKSLIIMIRDSLTNTLNTTTIKCTVISNSLSKSHTSKRAIICNNLHTITFKVAVPTSITQHIENDFNAILIIS
jgi:hypothetical protein